MFSRSSTESMEKNTMKKRMTHILTWSSQRQARPTGFSSPGGSLKGGTLEDMQKLARERDGTATEERVSTMEVL